MNLPNDINPRIAVFIFLFFAIYIIVFQNWLLFAPASFLFPHQPSIVVNNSSNNTIIIYRTVEKLVTPTPDGKIFFASEYQNGTRLLKRPFSFIRYNALGKMDMKVTTIVYDYRIFEKLHWFNPTDYKYYEMLPENPNNKFLFIFVYVFMDDIIGDDTRLWTFNRNFFAVYDNFEITRPIEYPYQLRFKELENTPSFDESIYIQAFKSRREYSNTVDTIKSAGEYNDEIYYLRGGKSNAIDGYLLFEIPKFDTPESITVLGQFYTFGDSQWRLRN